MRLNKNSEAAYLTIRNSVAFSIDSRIQCIRLNGSNALEALELISPCDIFLQDGQMKHTLLLNEQGIPFADIYVSREGYNAYVLGYAKDEISLLDWFMSQTKCLDDFDLQNISDSHICINLDGPYSWELGAEVFGSDLLGLPYLGMMEMDKSLVFRAGRTGEYGYHFFVSADEKDAWLEKIKSSGQPYDMGEADEEALDLCALENFFFDITKEGVYNLNPMELQLQWRLSSQKTSYPGANEILKYRQEGWGRRMVSFVSPSDIKVNASITHDGKEIGKVLVIGYSPVRGEFVGKALLNKPYWHAGLDMMQADNASIQTISAPAIDNLSLKVSPYRNSFSTRNEDLS